MKIKYSFLLLLATMPLFLTSCLHDQEDVFDESASTRMQTYLSNAKSTLTSAEHGWAFDYYPDRKLSRGGVAYGVQFSDTAATVTCVLAPGEKETSYYRMTTDDGPVLSFDSYNTLMHYFATPSSSQYQAYDGDFEFVIDSVGSDCIKVHGKRSLNTMYLRKLDKSIEQYTTDAKAMMDNFILSGATGIIGGTEVTASIDVDSQWFTFDWSDSSSVSTAYIPTDKGVRFYEPVTIAGKTITELAYDAKTLTLTGTTTDGTAVQLQGKLPDGYMPFADYAGQWTFKYDLGQKSVDVTLTPSEDGQSYILSGLAKNINLTLNYEKSTGRLVLASQQVGTYNGNQIWLCAWNVAGGGNLTWDSKAGVYLTWDGNTEQPTLTFSPLSESFQTDSFILWTLKSDGSSGGQFIGPTDYLFGGSNRLPYLVNMVKK